MTKWLMLRYISYRKCKRIYRWSIIPILIVFVLFGSAPLYAQSQFQVKGKVTDAQTGQGLPGVNVVVKGTTIGTATDPKGHYELTISSPQDTLVFSYLGYTTRMIPVNGRHTINVSLKTQTIQGQEMVVVGYGTQKRSDLTGSITTVSSQKLSKVPVTDVAQALEGQVAGVNITQTSAIPGVAPSIMIRGQNSISANNSPLLVVDGVPFNGSFNDINPNNIANISILKGPSATAVYGVRGSNGVILITTKKGKKGKAQIQYHGYYGLQDIAHMLNPASPQQYLNKWKWYQLESGVPSNQLTPVPNSPGGNEYKNYKAGKTVNWMNEVTRPGRTSDNNLTISGATNTINYYISGEFLKTIGVIKGYNYTRANIRSTINADLTNYLKVGTNLLFNSDNYNGGQANMLFAEEMSPYGTLKNSNGTYTIFPDFPEELYQNPLLPLYNSRVSEYKMLEGQGTATLEPGDITGLGFLKGLQYKFTGDYSYNPSHGAFYSGRLAGNTTNGYANVNYTTNTKWIIDNLLTYKKDFGKNHINFTGLYEAQKFTNFYSTATSTGFINDQLLYNNLGAGSTQSDGSNAYSWTMASQMARLNYSYNNTYLLTLTVRRDGSSVMGANTNKYGVFPTAAVGWNVTNEKFMQNLRAINHLKLRFSYGKTGNAAINPNQTETTDGTDLYPFNNLPTVGTFPAVLGNANLHWESSLTSDLGIDFGVIHNRIRGSVDLYSTDTKGLLLQRHLPAVTGYYSVWANLGETTNKGIEVTLNTTNVESGSFLWQTNLTFASNQNRIVNLYGNYKSDIGNRWFIGHPIGVIYDYKMLGVWQTSQAAQAAKYNAKPGDLRFADLNGDGKINSQDLSILGQLAPKWTGGMTNTFSYRNFHLRVFIQTAQGMMKNNSQLNWVDLAGRRNIPAGLTYWTPDNHNNSMPALTYTNTIGYGYPRNASYTRLKEVTLSYTLPQSDLDKTGLGGLTVYLSGTNLYTWTPWFGWDPEHNYAPRGAYGFTTNYPNVRQFVLGVNITL